MFLIKTRDNKYKGLKFLAIIMLFYRWMKNTRSYLTKSSKLIVKYIIIYLLIFPLFARSASAETNTHLLEKNHAVSYSKGERFYSLMLGASEDYKKKIGPILHAKFTVNNYVYDNFAFTYGLSLGHANPKDTQDGFQGGPHLGFRKHFINAKQWSVYVDGSAGAISHQYPLEENSFRFNFELEAGFGIAYRIAEKSALLGGFRHYHLSNARIAGDKGNVGYDAPMFYMGFMKSF